MDKVLYRLMVGLACLILIGFLILTPVFTSMYMKMVKREERMEQTEKRIDKKIQKLERLLKGE